MELTSIMARGRDSW